MIHNKFNVGELYSRKSIGELIGKDEPTFKTSREGLFYCKNSKTTILFSNLIKKGEFLYNDYFEGDYFHWDSQNQQHINTRRIQEIVKKEIEVILFCRKTPKTKGVTQPHVYCGRLEFNCHEKGTKNPVHIIFNSIDYNDVLNNSNLNEIWGWEPDKRSEINLSKEISDKRKSNYKKPNTTERQGIVTSRVGQGWLRTEVLKRWKRRCSVTGCKIDKILIASHIVPWSKSSENERLDVGNCLLLSPNLDSLFDSHQISFKDSGEIIISDDLDDEDLQILNIDNQMRLRRVFDDMKPYLSRHRKVFAETTEDIKFDF